MTKDEALRIALEAMKVNNNAWESLADSGDAGFWKAQEQGYYQLNEKAITAVKAALEANEFNPDWDTQAVLAEEIQRMAKRIEELEAKDEPVAWIWKYANGEEEVVFVPPRHVDASHVDAPSTITSLYTTPPQRKPLTDEEIFEALGGIDCTRPTLIARAIEAAHGIKGEA